ncbi:MAG TPA: hypothetical protein VNI20_05025 [Fimbriimonadaceae bacterium]|nr:hypothetical protein [Fimbriimonadaceae bacterium]
MNPAGQNQYQALVQGSVKAFPTFAVSLVFTEAFVHLHSFSLELVCFAGLWGALYSVQNAFVRGLQARRSR